MRQRVGVVLAARAARERQQLGHHGQQQRELVGRPRQVHKHAALEQRLAGLRARAPSSAAAQRAGCSPSLCHLQRTAHRSGMHLRVPLHTIASDNGLLGRLRMAGGCSGARAGGAPAGRRAAAAGRARRGNGGRGAAGTARACAGPWRPPRAAAAPRSATNAPPPSARPRVRARSTGSRPMQDTVPFRALRCQYFPRNNSISGPAYGHDKHSGMSTQRVEPGRPGQPGRAHPRPAARTRPGSRTARGRMPPRST